MKNQPLKFGFIFQMVVTDEVHEQMNDIAFKQIKNIEKINSEIRKQKVIIVKPKSRIPTLKIL